MSMKCDQLIGVVEPKTDPPVPEVLPDVRSPKLPSGGFYWLLLFLIVADLIFTLLNYFKR